MRYTEIINEYNRDITAKNYAAKLVAVARRDRSLPAQFRDPKAVTDEQLADVVLDQIEKSDPTPNKEYAQGLAKMYAQGETQFEDMGSTLADYLAKFHKLKQKKVIPAPRNDFMRYSSVADFMGVVDEYPDVGEELKDKGASEQVYQDAQLRIIRPDNEAAACYYGQGTKWCTAAKNHNMFDTYNKQGSMYIVMPRQPAYGGEKYQFHFPSAQFMNEQDRPVDLVQLLARFPQLKDVFHDEARQHNNIPFLFRGTEQEYQAVMQKISQYVSQGVKETLQDMNGNIGRTIAAAITDDVKMLRGLKSDLADMLADDVVETADWWAETMVDMIDRSPADLSNADQLESSFEGSADLMEWVTQTDAWAYITDLLEDEEGSDDDTYQAAMAMQYTMVRTVSKYAVVYWKEALEEFMP